MNFALKKLAAVMLSLSLLFAFTACLRDKFDNAALSDYSVTQLTVESAKTTHALQAGTSAVSMEETAAATTAITTAAQVKNPTTTRPAATTTVKPETGTTLKPSVTNPPTVPTISGAANIINSAVLHPVYTNCEDLDSLVRNIFSEIFKSGMDTYDKVKACYDYLINNTRYDPDYDRSFVWLKPEMKLNYAVTDAYIIKKAYALLKLDSKIRFGVCDQYSSAFTVMTRAIGLDSYNVIGTTTNSSGAVNSHRWVNIKINGTYYVFDPQVEDKHKAADGSIRYAYFCKRDSEVTFYTYTNREAEIAKFNSFKPV